MKKTISLVLVFAFIFVLALQLPVLADDATGTATETPMLTSVNPEATNTATSTQPRPEPRTEQRPEPRTEQRKGTSTLEKIPSPEHINLYNQIKKIGSDLFGIRKASSTINNIQKNEDKKATTTPNIVEKKINELKKAGLEKITSLDHLNLFEKVTKIGNDLFGLKKKGAMVLPTMTPELIACTSAAIDAKDASVNISITASVAEITAAIDARGVCQKAALALASGHEDAVKTCNKTFQETVKAANEKARVSQKATWDIYKTSLDTCSKGLNIEDSGDILK
jgi:hypothetical protein